MVVAPTSKIYLLSGVPLDNTYQNTIYFASESDQINYFISKQKYTLSNYTYLRRERVLRVGVLADNLLNCNYIMFQNSSFGNKWFYGFITEQPKYINNETSEIVFEIDVMQTWHFDYKLLPSFVEREHSTTDAIGDNLVPDNLETGDYICADFDGTQKMGAYNIIVAATFDDEFNDATGGMYTNIYSGLYYHVFTNYEDVNAFIDEAVTQNKGSGIVSVFMMPSAFVVNVGESPATFTITKAKNISDIDGYKPKNNKLFTYPYNFLYVTNLNGNSAEYHYEYFSDQSCNFGLTGDMSCNPQVVLFPQNYKGITANYNEKMVIDGFPQCSYNTDSFKAWLAQSGASNIVKLAGTGLGVAASSLGTPAAIGAVGAVGAMGVAPLAIGIGAGVAIAGILTSAYEHYTLPPQANNSQGNSAMTALRIKDFAFIHMSIRSEFAKIIDDYWNVYGYPCHEVKTPNRTVRPHWNYVKTVGINLSGSIPVEDMTKIKSIYNNGVTFWKVPSEVGNYSLDNSLPL